jgi:hypothetical protein
MKNKKGLSMIITTLIIILLVLVAVGIIWVVVRNIVEKGTEQINYNTKCIDVDVRANAVVNTSMTDYSVTLTRTASGEDIAGVKLIFFNAAAETSTVIDVSGNIAPLATITRSVAGGIVDANKVEVTSYFTDASGDEQICSQTRSYSF